MAHNTTIAPTLSDLHTELLLLSGLSKALERISNEADLPCCDDAGAILALIEAISKGVLSASYKADYLNSTIEVAA